MQPHKSNFVNRVHEINTARDLVIQAASNKNLDKRILYFYGAPLIGKSFLLHQIISDIDGQDLQQPKVLIEFDKAKLDNQQLITEIVKQLNQSLSTTKTGTLLDDSKTTDELASDLVDLVKGLPKTKQPLWILDALENANQSTWEWLQEKLFLPLIQEDRLIIIIATRITFDDLGDFNFELKYEIKRRIQICRIEPFGIDHNKEHLKNLKTDITEYQIQTSLELAKGFPGLNIAAIQYSRDTSIDEFLAKELKPIFFHCDPEKSDVLWNLAHLLSGFRYFDAKMLLDVGQRFLGDSLISPDDDNLKSLRISWQWIKMLQQNHLCERHREHYGYCINPNFRSIFYNSLRSQKPKDVYSLHYFAIQKYTDRYYAKDLQSIKDMLYHQCGVIYAHNAISPEDHEQIKTFYGNTTSINFWESSDFWQNQLQNLDDDTLKNVHHSIYAERDAWQLVNPNGELSKMIESIYKTH